MRIENIARWAIGFTWIYHGIAIKLLTIAPIEYYLSSQLGFSETITYWFIKVAGVFEVVFGLAFIAFYTKKIMLYLNIVIMVLLIVMVGFLDSKFLIEGFNPVTTNMPIIALSMILLNQVSINRITKVST